MRKIGSNIGILDFFKLLQYLSQESKPQNVLKKKQLELVQNITFHFSTDVREYIVKCIEYACENIITSVEICFKYYMN